MTIKLGSNTASLNAQRRLGEATATLGGIYERLSSGQRINRASDDAAGLAIADDLNAKGRVYTQAIRNGNDGISLLNIADSAIDALTDVVVRIRELSEQAANGTYSNKQRLALDAEAQQLSAEFTRITQTTSFNGLKVFNGSLGTGIRLQLGYGTSESINASIGGAIGTGQFGNLNSFTAESNFSQDIELGDLNGDGILDLVSAGKGGISGKATVRLGLGNGSFGSINTYTAEDFYTAALLLGDLNDDGILDLVTTGFNTSYESTATVRLGLGDGTFGSMRKFTTSDHHSSALALGDINGDGLLDLITAGYNEDSYTYDTEGYANIRLGLGNGDFGAATTIAMDNYKSFAVRLSDINNDGKLDLLTAGQSLTSSADGSVTIRLGLGNGMFGSSISYSTEDLYSDDLQVADLNADGMMDLVTVGSDGNANIRFGTGTGTFGESTAYSMQSASSTAIELADLNGDSFLDLITAGRSSSNIGSAAIRLGLGNGNFGSLISFSTEGTISAAVTAADIDGDNVLDLITGGYDAQSGKISTRLASTQNGLGSILEFSLKTRAEALQAMGNLDSTLQCLAKQRGTIGASQSRVNIAISNLLSSRENFKAAESRIRDADISAEAAARIRTEILQQSAASVLAQANQAPTLALQLLK